MEAKTLLRTGGRRRTKTVLDRSLIASLGHKNMEGVLNR